MSALDKFMRGFGRLVIGTFFDRVGIDSAQNFPAIGPVLVVANHPNSLIDGALLASYLPRYSKLIAASTVWNYRLLVPLLSAAGVIPVFRRHEVGSVAGTNDGAFDAATKVLARQSVLSIFPEGVSHNSGALQPVKKGAARIALSALKGPTSSGLRIVPVAITYESKTRFRSRAQLQIGVPIDPSLYSSQATGAVAKLTAAIRAGLDEALAQALDPGGPGRSSDTAERVHASGTQFDLPSRATAAPGPLGARLRRFLAGLAIVTATLPNGFPWLLSRWLARGKDLDKRATWSVFASIILFPVAWVAFALAGWGLAMVNGGAWAEYSGIVAAACFLSGPVLGILAARMWDWRSQARNPSSLSTNKTRLH